MCDFNSDRDQHGLVSTLCLNILLCPWVRHFKALLANSFKF